MNPYYQDRHVTIFHGDCRSMELPDKSVQCVVTSPPYWGLRKYEGGQEEIWGGVPDCEHEWTGAGTVSDVREQVIHGRSRTTDRFYGEPSRRFDGNHQKHYQDNTCLKCGAWKGSYGLEPTPEMYVEHTVEFLREIRRVLRDDGIVFWNIGDSYSGSGKGIGSDHGKADFDDSGIARTDWHTAGLKPKDLCLIPFRVALAAQSDGWYVRSVIIWAKPNPMPESVKDRPTSSYEYILMLTKSQRYYWDIDAVREAQSPTTHSKGRNPRTTDEFADKSIRSDGKVAHKDWHEYTPETWLAAGRNLRDVWTIPTQPFPGAHFAVFPEKIPETCIKAATSEKGCCSKCGAPWVRVVDRSKALHTGKTDSAYGKGSTAHRLALLRQAAREDGGEYQQDVRTTGWQPSCFCGTEHPIPQAELDADPTLMDDFEIEAFQLIPCTVLDPFMGSGTTLAVAKSLGRRAIGVDVSEEYCAMAVKRCGAQMVMEF